MRSDVKSVHLTNAYHPTSGGVRTVYRALLASANRHGRYVRLIVPGPRHDMEEAGPFGRIYYVKAPRAFAVDSRYRVILPHSYLAPATQGVAAILRDEQPDVLEVCDKLSLFYVAGLLRKGWMAGVPRPVLVGLSAERFDDAVGACISRNAPTKSLAGWYMRHIYTPMFDYHVANSDYTAAELRAALPPHRQRVVHVCPPGVDTDVFDVARATPDERRCMARQLGGDEHTALLLYAGRLSPEKNVPLLLDALAVLMATEHRDRRNYRLVVAGDGPLIEPLRADAARRCPGRCTFLGNVADRAAFRSLLSIADLVVHPNPREPFGIAPLEAMAAGVPVVLPEAGGVLTYATPDTAWLAAPQPAAFALAIREAIRQPALARAKAAGARRRAEDFRLPDVIERLFHLYDQFHEERLEHHARTAFARTPLGTRAGSVAER